MKHPQNERIPEHQRNVYLIQEAPSYLLRVQEEQQLLAETVDEQQRLEDQEARETLREHLRSRIQQLGLYAVRSEKE